MALKLRDEASRLLLAAALLGAGSASAQDYPASTETAALSGWLGESTNIAPSTVVAVTPELVVAIVGKTMPATPGGPVRLTLREEVIAPGYVDAVGGRSSLMSMEIHCEERRVRMDERRLYAGLNLTGAMEMTDPSAEWVRIPEGSIMDDVARAACEAEFSWPLARPASPNIAVAALGAPTPVLPPGPDAKVAPDEPELVEEKIIPVEAAPVPEAPAVSPAEVVVEALPEAEAPVAEVAEPAVAAETAIPPEMETPAPAPEPREIEPPVEAASSLPPEIEAVPPQEEPAATAEAPAPPETEISAPEPAEIEASPEPQPAAPAVPEQPVPVEAEIIPPPIEPPPVEMAMQAIPEPAPTPEPRIAPPSPAGRAFAVQIGAYETREIAEEAWAELSADRPILVEGLTFEIQLARVKGKTWRRGLVGRFASRPEAEAFCTAIAGGEYGCILRTLAD